MDGSRDIQTIEQAPRGNERETSGRVVKKRRVRSEQQQIVWGQSKKKKKKKKNLKFRCESATAVVSTQELENSPLFSPLCLAMSAMSTKDWDTIQHSSRHQRSILDAHSCIFDKDQVMEAEQRTCTINPFTTSICRLHIVNIINEIEHLYTSIYRVV